MKYFPKAGYLRISVNQAQRLQEGGSLVLVCAALVPRKESTCDTLILAGRSGWRGGVFPEDWKSSVLV